MQARCAVIIDHNDWLTDTNAEYSNSGKKPLSSASRLPQGHMQVA